MLGKNKLNFREKGLETLINNSVGQKDSETSPTHRERSSQEFGIRKIESRNEDIGRDKLLEWKQILS